MAEVHVKGLAELGKRLQEVPEKLRRNVIRGALRAGAKVILVRAQQNIRSRSGVLAKSLKVGTRAKGTTVYANVKTKVFYGRFVEYGTAAHDISGRGGGWLHFGGQFRRSVEHLGSKPYPFMRPALDTQAQAALVAIAERMKARMTKEGIDVADVTVEGDE